MPAHFIDLTGHVFGLLTVREAAGFNERRQSIWKCECLCGEFITTRGSDLVSGDRRRCSSVNCRYQPPRIRISFTTIGQRGVIARKVNHDAE